MTAPTDWLDGLSPSRRALWDAIVDLLKQPDRWELIQWYLDNPDFQAMDKGRLRGLIEISLPVLVEDGVLSADEARAPWADEDDASTA